MYKGLGWFGVERVGGVYMAFKRQENVALFDLPISGLSGKEGVFSGGLCHIGNIYTTMSYL